MKKLPHLTTTTTIRLGGFILVSYIALLIGLVHLGQTHLRQSLIKQSRLTIEKQAMIIHYLLNDQRDEVQELTKNPIIHGFFLNRAMGMSMEYGLRASLTMIQTELNRLRQRKKILDQPTFSIIRFVDKDGTVLASTKTNDQQKINPFIPAINDQNRISIRIVHDRQAGCHIRYIAGISHDHQVNGFIVGDVDPARVILPLLQLPEDRKSNNTLTLLGPKGQVLASTRPVNKMPVNSTDIDHRITVTIPLGDSGYTLQGIIQPNQSILLTSPWFLAAIALLSLPVLGGALFLFQLNNNHLVLQAKYDVSQQQELLTQQANNRVNAVLAGIDAIVYVTDMETSRIVYANAAATSLYGELTDRICWQALYGNQDGPCSFCAKDNLLDKDNTPRPTRTMEFQDRATKRWFHCADCAIPWDDGRYVHLRVATDITDRIKNEQALKEAHKQLETLAYYDPLTRLANRRLFIDRLQHAFSLSDRTRTGLAICYMDLDNFKDINDTHGHETGDRLLIQVSERLQENLRVGDTVARWGGDEFSILINGQQDANQCARTLSRLIENLTRPYTINNTVFQVTTSIGITLYPHDKGDPETLLRHADQAMYLAKQQGRNRYHFFDPEQDRRISRQRQKLSRIKTAIQHDEMRLFYQPKIDMASGKFIGAEALIRWQHPDEGLLPPGRFLPLLEGNSLQTTLDWWVLDCAIAQISAWHGILNNFVVSVNISARTIQDKNFTGRLTAILQKHGVDGSLVELEILESGILEDLEAISSVIRKCARIGISFALDDYGTGYSTLTHIRRLPVQTLKIDQSFVRGMLTSIDDLHIVEGVIALARAFELEVIAEGVETTETGSRLLTLGCRYAQGFCIAKPMPPTELIPWTTRYRIPDQWLTDGQVTGEEKRQSSYPIHGALKN